MAYTMLLDPTIPPFHGKSLEALKSRLQAALFGKYYGIDREINFQGNLFDSQCFISMKKIEENYIFTFGNDVEVEYDHLTRNIKIALQIKPLFNLDFLDICINLGFGTTLRNNIRDLENYPNIDRSVLNHGIAVSNISNMGFTNVLHNISSGFTYCLLTPVNKHDLSLRSDQIPVPTDDYVVHDDSRMDFDQYKQTYQLLSFRHQKDWAIVQSLYPEKMSFDLTKFTGFTECQQQIEALSSDLKTMKQFFNNNTSTLLPMIGKDLSSMIKKLENLDEISVGIYLDHFRAVKLSPSYAPPHHWIHS